MSNESIFLKSRSFLREEYVFALIVLLFGIFYSFLNPPFQGKNETLHFYNSYVRSEGTFSPIISEENSGFMLPRSIVNTNNAFKTIDFNNKKINQDLVDTYGKVILNESDREFVSMNGMDANPVVNFHNYIGILIGKIFSTNPLKMLWSARISGIIFYILIIFLAIKWMPFFKSVFLLIAASPNAVYSAASVGSDGMILALSLLFTALIFKMTAKNNFISGKDILIFVIICILHRFMKDGYFLLPFLFLIVPKKNFKNSFNYYLIIIFLILMIFLPSLVWNSAFTLSDGSLAVYKSGDYHFDENKNLALHFSQIVKSKLLVLSNIYQQGNEWVNGLFSGFGSANAFQSQIVSLIQLVVLVSIALISGNNEVKISTFKKFYSVAVAFCGMFVLMLIYLIFNSPVGSELIYGFHGLYLLPFIPLIFVPLLNNNLKVEIFDKFGSIILGVYCIIFLSIAAIFINDFFYI